MNIFSEIIELSSFDQITKCAYKNTYRNYYGTPHVFIRLLVERRANLDQIKTIAAVLLDLSKSCAVLCIVVQWLPGNGCFHDVWCNTSKNLQFHYFSRAFET